MAITAPAGGHNIVIPIKRRVFSAAEPTILQTAKILSHVDAGLVFFL